MQIIYRTWQDEIIDNHTTNYLVRAPRAAGKSYLCAKWAISHIKLGRKVFWAFEDEHSFAYAITLVSRIATEEGVLITGHGVNYTHFANGARIFFFTLGTRSAVWSAGLDADAIIYDDADLMDIEHQPYEWRNIRYKLLTACDLDGFFYSVRNLMPEFVYKEFDYLHVIQSGIRTQDFYDKIKANMTEEQFQIEFGPWTNGNARHASVLERYDA